MFPPIRGPWMRGPEPHDRITQCLVGGGRLVETGARTPLPSGWSPHSIRTTASGALVVGLQSTTSTPGGAVAFGNLAGASVDLGPPIPLLVDVSAVIAAGEGSAAVVGTTNGAVYRVTPDGHVTEVAGTERTGPVLALYVEATSGAIVWAQQTPGGVSVLGEGSPSVHVETSTTTSAATFGEDGSLYLAGGSPDLGVVERRGLVDLSRAVVVLSHAGAPDHSMFHTVAVSGSFVAAVSDFEMVSPMGALALPAGGSDDVAVWTDGSASLVLLATPSGVRAFAHDGEEWAPPRSPEDEDVVLVVSVTAEAVVAGTYDELVVFACAP